SLSRLYNLYRTRTNYLNATFPGIGRISDPTDLLPMPDVDNDPHLFIVFTDGLGDGVGVIANPIDSLLTPVAPSGYSNLHETLFVSATAYPDSAFDALPYFNLIARALYAYVMNANNPDGAAWLIEALGWLLFF